MYARSGGEEGYLETGNPTISRNDFKREEENIGAIIDPKNHPDYSPLNSIEESRARAERQRSGLGTGD